MDTVSLMERGVFEGTRRGQGLVAAPRKAAHWWAWGAVLPVVAALLWWNFRPVPPPSPRATIQGGDGGGLARATPAQEHFDATALGAASAFADTQQAQAFIVMRHNHVVVEHYGHGADHDTWADAGGFAAALTALAAGIAEADGKISMQDIAGGDLTRIATAIETASRQRYSDYLSQHIWSRLNASPAWISLPSASAATPADCCVHARVTDWMRVASLLLDDGNFEGERLIPAGWVDRIRAPRSASGDRGLGVWRSAAAQGAEAFAADDMFYLRGPGRWRLWLAPTLALAVLLAADNSPAPTWDETRLPNLVIRAVADLPARRSGESGLNQLVPGH